MIEKRNFIKLVNIFIEYYHIFYFILTVMMVTKRKKIMVQFSMIKFVGDFRSGDDFLGVFLLLPTITENTVI